MLKQSFAMISILTVTTLGGCKKQNAETALAPAADKAAAKPAAAPTPAAPAAASATAPAAAATGHVPSADKEMLGLDLAPIGAWTPKWKADPGVVDWENSDDFMKSIQIRIVDDKLDNIDDLKAAEKTLDYNKITEVVENKTTPKGWYAVVKLDDDSKTTRLIYIQKYGGTKIECAGSINYSNTPAAKKEDILKACDSIKVK